MPVVYMLSMTASIQDISVTIDSRRTVSRFRGTSVKAAAVQASTEMAGWIMSGSLDSPAVGDHHQFRNDNGLTNMIDDEDYEFSIETSTGLRNVVISKIALGRITGGNHGWSKDLIAGHHDKIVAILERKIAKGRVGAGQIRIHGTDS